MDERNLQALRFNYFSMKCVVDRCNINSPLANGVIVDSSYHHRRLEILIDSFRAGSIQ